MPRPFAEIRSPNYLVSSDWVHKGLPPLSRPVFPHDGNPLISSLISEFRRGMWQGHCVAERPRAVQEDISAGCIMAMLSLGGPTPGALKQNETRKGLVEWFSLDIALGFPSPRSYL